MDEVDENNIALIAVSLGGYLGPRAAAYEHRLKALIANPGVVDWSIVYSDFLNEIDPDLMTVFKTDTEMFDQYIYQYMDHVPVLEWGMVDSMWHHNTTTPTELMQEVQRFINRDTAKDISACTMIIDADLESRGQSKELYDALVNCPNKTYVKFTVEEAAQFHVQPGATAILSARMFNWLDEIFEVDLGSTSSATTSEVHADDSLGYYRSLFVATFSITSLAIALTVRGRLVTKSTHPKSDLNSKSKFA